MTVTRRRRRPARVSAGRRLSSAQVYGRFVVRVYIHLS